MRQVFLNVHVYAKQKINLTWPQGEQCNQKTILVSSGSQVRSEIAEKG